MPLLTLILTKNATGIVPCEIFGSVSKQPLIWTGYLLQCESTLPYFLLKLPFLNSYDNNTNAIIKGTIPIFPSVEFIDKTIIGPTQNNISQTTGNITYSQLTQNFEITETPQATFRNVNYEFNIARNIPQIFSDFELYASDGTPIDFYEIVLNRHVIFA